MFDPPTIPAPLSIWGLRVNDSLQFYNSSMQHLQGNIENKEEYFITVKLMSSFKL